MEVNLTNGKLISVNGTINKVELFEVHIKRSQSACHAKHKRENKAMLVQHLSHILAKYPNITSTHKSSTSRKHQQVHQKHSFPPPPLFIHPFPPKQVHLPPKLLNLSKRPISDLQLSHLP